MEGTNSGGGGGSGAHSSSSDSETSSSKPSSPGGGKSPSEHGPHKRKRRNWTDDELARLRSAIQIYGNNLELIRKNFNLEERQPRVLRRKIHEIQAKMKQEKKGSMPKLTNEEDESDEPRYDYEMQLTFESNTPNNMSMSGDGSANAAINGAGMRSTQPFAPWMIIDKGVLNLVWQELPQRSYSVSFAISSECIYMTAEVMPPSPAQLAFLNLSDPSPQLPKTSFVGKYVFPPEITVWPNTLSVSHHAGLFVVRATINNPQKRFELSVPPVVEPMLEEISGLVDASSGTARTGTTTGTTPLSSSSTPTTTTTTTTTSSLPPPDPTSTAATTTPHHLSTLGSAAVVASPLSSSSPSTNATTSK